MSIREGAGFRGRRSIAALMVLAVMCGAAAVAVARVTHSRVGTAQGTYGTMLAGGNGHTLYMLSRDQWHKSTCYKTCAQIWPPDYTRGRPVLVAGSGLNPHLLGTTRRRSGALQVTYNGHPLYFYSQDLSQGDMNGEGQMEFGGSWYVLGPLGRAKKPGFNPGTY